MHQTPNSNNDNSAPKAAADAAHPQSHIVKLTSVGSLTFSSVQEPTRDEDSLHKGRKRKATTQAVQISSIGQHEIENSHPTELPSADYACQYVKDRLTGKITCMVCGEEGHYTCDCPMRDKEEKVICTLCNRVGHCHLWCCRQNVSVNRACHRCGEKGHYANKKLCDFGEKCSHNREVSCSSCDTNHPLGDCPMEKITCFLCEGKRHVPAECRLSPMLTIATQYYRESLHATLKKLMTETTSRTSTPVKPSAELPHYEVVPKVSNFSSSNGQGHSKKKNPMRSEVPDSDKTNHATMKNKAPMPVSKSICYKCHEEGHYAKRCPRKKPYGELGLHDVTGLKKKLTRELELCDVTCFTCHDKGHKSYNCPKKGKSGELKLSDVTCPKKGKSEELKLSDVTCFKCHNKGHYMNDCPEKEPPGELELSDVICLKCHDKGHYTYSCPKMKPPGHMMIEINANLTETMKCGTLPEVSE